MKPDKLTLAHDFGFEMLSDEELEVRMYGRIGNSFFEEGITAKLIGETLSKAPSAKKLKVKLSSPGGNVGDGMAIRSMLATHPAHVTIDVEGLAASAASVIAMSGDTIRMHDGASFMLHEGRSFGAEGTIRDLQRTISALETINDGAATIYAARTGKSKEDIRQMMATETWLTPEQALAQGFVDEVVPAKKQAAAQMFFDLAPYRYENVPPDIAARCRSVLHTPSTRSTQRKETEATMSYARIAIALGAAENADENTILQAIDTLKTTAARSAAVVAELCDLTSKPNAMEALGVARAHAASTERVTTLEAQLAQSTVRFEEQERAAIFAADAADPKGRKFTPAMQAFWKDKPLEMLKAFASSASYVVASVLPLRPPAGGAPAPDGTPPANTPPAAGGGGGPKTWAEMSYMEKHQLKRREPELYREMKRAAEEAS